MSDTGDDLRALFPAQSDSEHHRRLVLRHRAVTLEIARIEAELDTELEARLEALKKQRLALLDQIAAITPDTQSA